MANEIAERAEKRRDLKSQIAGLTAEDAGEIVFLHISPGREPVTIYRKTTGEPVQVPAYMVDNVMEKAEDGQPMFVSRKEDAPEFKLGTFKCFLHPDSPDRAILNEIGLMGTRCPANHLASLHSKREHGRRRHKAEWAAYQEYLDDAKEQKGQERQEKQLQATLALAGRAAEAPKGECDICGRSGFKNVGAHKRGAHK
jgi:hypothetical protein